MPQDDQQGISIVLFPVQLAAILEGAHLSSGEILANRLWGSLQLAGSASN